MLVLEELTALIPVLPMAVGVAKAYGTIRADLALRGQLIGNNDLWIAAHAKSLGLTLVPSNESEFRRVRPHRRKPDLVITTIVDTTEVLARGFISGRAHLHPTGRYFRPSEINLPHPALLHGQRNRDQCEHRA